ncbi:MAG: penicillin-binding protein activator [Candidatus Woesearchaeota archaeon]|jgi:branched-chain amino acid transport system substrate-binding protein|nr:penicillin-binding protein activator [Candidatus Woesearchaeota archaeon]MDP7323565.1 penicillin-binding protein activator [Candidatus Woesearchaeota archaeon]MDP7457677.1 penicillin-binding protein activator [Candidatus Woesearchaeota archaeon]
MKIKIIVGLMLMLSILLGCTEAPSAPSTQEVTIGVMLPLSGDVASYGEGVMKGLQMAVKDSDVNVVLKVEDSKCEGKEAVSAINKLISLDGVDAILGELCSGATLAAAPVAEENQVVMVSPASTSPDISEAGDFIFRTIPSDALQGVFAANLIYDADFRKLSILYSNEDYGVGISNVISKAFTDLGGEVVASETYERKSVDLRAQLTKIKGSGADAIFIAGNSPDSFVAALKQIQELGLEVALYGSEGLKAPYTTENAGLAAEGLIVSSVSSGTSDFIAKHNAEFGEGPGPFAAQGYDALTSIVWAVKLGATTPVEIKDNLYNVQFDGASGNIVFDDKGEVSGNYEVYVVSDGAFVLVE